MQPDDLECVTCDGKGCSFCNRSGVFTLTSCARKQVTPAAWMLLKWVNRAEERGILPVAGGGLDQTRSFLDAWDFIAGEFRHWRNKLGLTDA